MQAKIITSQLRNELTAHLITLLIHQRNTQFNFLSQTDHLAVAHIFDITLEHIYKIMIKFKQIKALSTCHRTSPRTAPQTKINVNKKDHSVMQENDNIQMAQNKRWYLAQCKPNATHIAVRNLENQDFVSFLPLQEGVKRKGKGFQHQIRPLFPGYLFVQLDATEGPWCKINSTRGIARLVRLGAEPSVVPNALIADLMARCDEMGIIQDAGALVVGDRVQVTQGPFSGFFATVADVEANARIYILLDIMGQSTKVSIGSEALTPLE